MLNPARTVLPEADAVCRMQPALTRAVTIAILATTGHGLGAAVVQGVLTVHDRDTGIGSSTAGVAVGAF